MLLAIRAERGARHDRVRFRNPDNCAARARSEVVNAPTIELERSGAPSSSARNWRASARMTLSAKLGVSLMQNRNAFSETAASVTSVSAIAVAPRGSFSISEISPKMPFGLDDEDQAIAEMQSDTAALNAIQLGRRVAFLENRFSRLE